MNLKILITFFLFILSSNIFSKSTLILNIDSLSLEPHYNSFVVDNINKDSIISIIQEDLVNYAELIAPLINVDNFYTTLIDKQLGNYEGKNCLITIDKQNLFITLKKSFIREVLITKDNFRLNFFANIKHKITLKTDLLNISKTNISFSIDELRYDLSTDKLFANEINYGILDLQQSKTKKTISFRETHINNNSKLRKLSSHLDLMLGVKVDSNFYDITYNKGKWNVNGLDTISYTNITSKDLLISLENKLLELEDTLSYQRTTNNIASEVFSKIKFKEELLQNIPIDFINTFGNISIEKYERFLSLYISDIETYNAYDIKILLNIIGSLSKIHTVTYSDFLNSNITDNILYNVRTSKIISTDDSFETDSLSIYFDNIRNDKNKNFIAMKKKLMTYITTILLSGNYNNLNNHSKNYNYNLRSFVSKTILLEQIKIFNSLSMQSETQFYNYLMDTENLLNKLTTYSIFNDSYKSDIKVIKQYLKSGTIELSELSSYNRNKLSKLTLNTLLQFHEDFLKVNSSNKYLCRWKFNKDEVILDYNFNCNKFNKSYNVIISKDIIIPVKFTKKVATHGTNDFNNFSINTTLHYETKQTSPIQNSDFKGQYGYKFFLTLKPYSERRELQLSKKNSTNNEQFYYQSFKFHCDTNTTEGKLFYEELNKITYISSFDYLGPQQPHDCHYQSHQETLVKINNLYINPIDTTVRIEFNTPLFLRTFENSYLGYWTIQVNTINNYVETTIPINQGLTIQLYRGRKEYYTQFNYNMNLRLGWKAYTDLYGNPRSNGMYWQSEKDSTNNFSVYPSVKYSFTNPTTIKKFLTSLLADKDLEKNLIESLNTSKATTIQTLLKNFNTTLSDSNNIKQLKNKIPEFNYDINYNGKPYYPILNVLQGDGGSIFFINRFSFINKKGVLKEFPPTFIHFGDFRSYYGKIKLKKQIFDSINVYLYSAE